MTRLCQDCRWIGPTHRGFDARFARCLHPTSVWLEPPDPDRRSKPIQLSCLFARSRTVSSAVGDLCGELGRHWEPRDPGESVEAAVDGPRPGRDGAGAEPA
jgi:hypothetical protein